MPSPLTGVVKLVILELDDSPFIFTESIDSGEKCADVCFNSCKAFSASLLSLVCINNAALIAMLLDVAVTLIGVVVVGIAFAFTVAVTPVTVAIPFAAAVAAPDVDVEDVVRSCEMLDSWLCTFDSKLLHLPMTLIISSRLLLIFCFINAKRFPGGLVNVVRPQLLQIGVAGLFER